ncbi:MAG TPA: PilT/PilU family type 4a pilus ATPase [Actinomycetota bacterium]|nr:PilT/PilU family type 4a pilus ATPase [Actinomycetota bacterium]
MQAEQEITETNSEDRGAPHLHSLLSHMVENECSDLHVKVGSPPSMRTQGLLVKLDLPTVTPQDGDLIAAELMTKDQFLDLEEAGEVDFAYSTPGLGRFRVNVHRQRGTLGIAVRRILPGVPTLEELGLPPVVQKLAGEHRGLLLVTGPTSSGKTTTCGAIVNHINETRPCHVLTVEDPIEILHRDDCAVVTQREVGEDTADFHTALRAAMRQDPDVIFVGEIRDMETVHSALQAAETGHFVLATLHTTNVAETVNRIVEFFPSTHQQQTRAALAGSLVGVISQRLIRKVGGGRAPAVEVMVMNGRIRDVVLDSKRTHQMNDIISESDFYGMQTFDQALIKLVAAQQISLEDAKKAADNPHDFELALKNQGVIPL